MYIHREIEVTIHEMLKQFKVVLVTGARQVGKTTVLKNSLEDSFSYVTLENPVEASNAENDSLLFFEMKSLPLVIDEVQRVPSLFQATKFIVDQSSEYGQIILTGSQTYHLMKGVSESLAGRIGILEMSGLSVRELTARDHPTPMPYVPSPVGTVERPGGFSLWERIQRGSMPQLCATDIPWERFWTSYTQAYLERDVRDLISLKSERKFFDFMVAAAARSGQLFNASDIANSIDVDYKTVQSWVSILQASGIVRLLQPFWPNIGKSLTKTPKLYFYDTGLLCYLLRIRTLEQLLASPYLGMVFENLVIEERMKTHLNAGREPDLYFYRDDNKVEVGLVDLTDPDHGILAEIKSSQTYRSSFSRHLHVVGDEIGIPAERRFVVERAEGDFEADGVQARNVATWLGMD